MGTWWNWYTRTLQERMPLWLESSSLSVPTKLEVRSGGGEKWDVETIRNPNIEIRINSNIESQKSKCKREVQKEIQFINTTSTPFNHPCESRGLKELLYLYPTLNAGWDVESNKIWKVIK